MRTILNKIACLTILLAGLALAGACSDDDKKEDCGCNSPVDETVEDVYGTLKKDGMGGYLITNGSGQWVMTYYICNKAIVNFEVPEGGVNVAFDAELMPYCGVYTDVPPAMARITSLDMAFE
jgi:hypothetical protein